MILPLNVRGGDVGEHLFLFFDRRLCLWEAYMCVEIGSAARGTDSTEELPPGSLLVDSRTLRVDWCLSVLEGGEVGKYTL